MVSVIAMDNGMFDQLYSEGLGKYTSFRGRRVFFDEIKVIVVDPLKNTDMSAVSLLTFQPLAGGGMN